MPISQRPTAVAAAVLAAACALTLSACGSSSGTSPASASNTSSTDQGTALPDANATATPSTGGSNGQPAAAPTKPSAENATAPAAAGGSAGTPRCHTQDLTLSFETGGDAAPDVTSDQQQTTGIAVRNRSGHTCVAGGFPGVDLNGGSTKWSLARKSAHYSAITLPAGGTTDFQITFQPEPKGKWTPQTVTVTPPNETTNVSLSWPWGPVLLQDGATHSSTYVGPIG
jgi:Protein of unknown function (DUF4232)